MVKGTGARLGHQIYQQKRAAGISTVRPDGSSTSIETDRQSFAAEEFAARELGADWSPRLLDGVQGDGGYDWIDDNGRLVDVKWLGLFPSGEPRTPANSHLIINPRDFGKCDIYIAVYGSIKTGFHLAGWCEAETLTTYPKKDFGYGLKYAIHASRLHPIETLNGVG